MSLLAHPLINCLSKRISKWDIYSGTLILWFVSVTSMLILLPVLYEITYIGYIIAVCTFMCIIMLLTNVMIVLHSSLPPTDEDQQDSVVLGNGLYHHTTVIDDYRKEEIQVNHTSSFIGDTYIYPDER